MPEKRYARRDPNEIVDIEHRDRLEDYVEPASGTVTVAHIVYGLHSISILTGLLTAGLSIAGAFVFSGPSILAVIILYLPLRRPRDVRGLALLLADPHVLVCVSLDDSHLHHFDAARFCRDWILYADRRPAGARHLGCLPNPLRLEAARAARTDADELMPGNSRLDEEQ